MVPFILDKQKKTNTFVINNSSDPGTLKDMNAMHLSKAASKNERQKKGGDDCADGNELNLQREKRGDGESLSPGAVRRDAVTGLHFPPSLTTQSL